MSSDLSREFDGRTALVTGGATGIGKALCVKLAARGAKIAVNYRTRDIEALALVSALRDRGVEVMAVQADLTDYDQARRLCRRVEEALGPISLLVNNAGRYASDPQAGTVAHLMAMLEANLVTTYVTTDVVVRSMKSRRFGRIVNIGSSAVQRVPPSAAPYAAAKAGVMTLTRAWAIAWGADNIRVNCIVPGVIETEPNADLPPAVTERLLAETPLHRMGLPSETADAVAYLLSDAASFITGQCLSVCGGRTAL